MLSFDLRRKPSIGRANPPVIPVADEIFPIDSLKFISGHFFIPVKLAGVLTSPWKLGDLPEG